MSQFDRNRRYGKSQWSKTTRQGEKLMKRLLFITMSKNYFLISHWSHIPEQVVF